MPFPRICLRSLAGLLLALSLCSPLSAQGPTGNAALAGHYYLDGRREVGSELLLTKDGRFEFFLAYGAVDRYAKGTWSVSGMSLTLTSDLLEEPRFALGPSEPELDPAYRERGEKTEILMCVEIGTPELGLVWRDVEITAGFSNGRTRTGLTGRDGMLGFEKRGEPEWAGAVVTRIGVAYPKHEVPQRWFEVAAGTRTQRVVLTPGWLVDNAFESLELEVGQDEKGPRLHEPSLGTYHR